MYLRRASPCALGEHKQLNHAADTPLRHCRRKLRTLRPPPAHPRSQLKMMHPLWSPDRRSEYPLRDLGTLVAMGLVAGTVAVITLVAFQP
jgi:hypothetical protein